MTSWVVGSQFRQSCRELKGRRNSKVLGPKLKLKKKRRDTGSVKYAFRNRMMKSQSGITVRAKVREGVIKCTIMLFRYRKGQIIGNKITRIAWLNYHYLRRLLGQTLKHHPWISTQTPQHMQAVTLNLARPLQARDQVPFTTRQFPRGLNCRTKKTLCSTQPRFILRLWEIEIHIVSTAPLNWSLIQGRQYFPGHPMAMNIWLKALTSLPCNHQGFQIALETQQLGQTPPSML